MMGSNYDGHDERPMHRVYLDGYYIDKYEVTTSRYAAFLKQTKRGEPDRWNEVGLWDGERPVIGVDWNDASAYCEWAGKRLPTEAEWEKAARGSDGRIYPWGVQIPKPDRAYFDKAKKWSGYRTLAKVGVSESGGSPYKAQDLVGNVSEWVADWYSETYYQVSPIRNPKGPSSGQYKVHRGASWKDGEANLRASIRFANKPTAFGDSIGFRCAMDVPR